MSIDISEKCGVFAAAAREGYSDELGFYVYKGLLKLKHRGHESAGICVWDATNSLRIIKDKGTVDVVFQEYKGENPLSLLAGANGIGHVRYSTSGESARKNAQPIIFDFHGKHAAIAHNGNLTNIEKLEHILEGRSVCNLPEASTSDTGLIACLIATSAKETFWEAFCETLSILEGSFSLVAMCENIICAARDRHGFRPLYVGVTEKFLLVASETVALDLFEPRNISEVSPGYAIRFVGGQYGIHDQLRWAEAKRRECIFEEAYFSHPASRHRDGSSYQIMREKTGRELAREHNIVSQNGVPQVVVAVPDSGNGAAHGYARACGKTLAQAIIREHMGRSFIQPLVALREEKNNLKFTYIPEHIRGKEILLIDDSLVRGTTAKRIIKNLRKHGAARVILLLAFPAVRHPCFWGIDFPTYGELIAPNRAEDEIARKIGADGVHYISLGGFQKARAEFGLKLEEACTLCVTGYRPSDSEKSVV